MAADGVPVVAAWGPPPAPLELVAMLVASRPLQTAAAGVASRHGVPPAVVRAAAAAVAPASPSAAAEEDAGGVAAAALGYLETPSRDAGSVAIAAVAAAAVLVAGRSQPHLDAVAAALFDTLNVMTLMDAVFDAVCVAALAEEGGGGGGGDDDRDEQHACLAWGTAALCAALLSCTLPFAAGWRTASCAALASAWRRAARVRILHRRLAAGSGSGGAVAADDAPAAALQRLVPAALMSLVHLLPTVLESLGRPADGPPSPPPCACCPNHHATLVAAGLHAAAAADAAAGVLPVLLALPHWLVSHAGLLAEGVAPHGDAWCAAELAGGSVAGVGAAGNVTASDATQVRLGSQRRWWDEDGIATLLPDGGGGGGGALLSQTWVPASQATGTMVGSEESSSWHLSPVLAHSHSTATVAAFGVASRRTTPRAARPRHLRQPCCVVSPAAAAAVATATAAACRPGADVATALCTLVQLQDISAALCAAAARRHPPCECVDDVVAAWVAGAARCSSPHLPAAVRAGLLAAACGACAAAATHTICRAGDGGCAMAAGAVEWMADGGAAWDAAACRYLNQRGAAHTVVRHMVACGTRAPRAPPSAPPPPPSVSVHASTIVSPADKLLPPTPAAAPSVPVAAASPAADDGEWSATQLQLPPSQTGTANAAATWPAAAATSAPPPPTPPSLPPSLPPSPTQETLGRPLLLAAAFASPPPRAYQLANPDRAAGGTRLDDTIARLAAVHLADAALDDRVVGVMRSAGGIFAPRSAAAADEPELAQALWSPPARSDAPPLASPPPRRARFGATPVTPAVPQPFRPPGAPAPTPRSALRRPAPAAPPVSPPPLAAVFVRGGDKRSRTTAAAIAAAMSPVTTAVAAAAAAAPHARRLPTDRLAPLPLVSLH